MRTACTLAWQAGVRQRAVAGNPRATRNAAGHDAQPGRRPPARRGARRRQSGPQVPVAHSTTRAAGSIGAPQTAAGPHRGAGPPSASRWRAAGAGQQARAASAGHRAPRGLRWARSRPDRQQRPQPAAPFVDDKGASAVVRPAASTARSDGAAWQHLERQHPSVFGAGRVQCRADVQRQQVVVERAAAGQPDLPARRIQRIDLAPTSVRRRAAAGSR